MIGVARGRIATVRPGGGTVSAPSALLLLLGATAAGRPWTGALAVVAFGAGMAVTLTGIGLAAATGGRSGLVAVAVRLARGGRPRRRVARLLPLAPAVAVVAGGGLLAARGVAAVLGAA